MEISHDTTQLFLDFRETILNREFVSKLVYLDIYLKHGKRIVFHYYIRQTDKDFIFTDYVDYNNLVKITVYDKYNEYFQFYFSPANIKSLDVDFELHAASICINVDNDEFIKEYLLNKNLFI